MGDRRATSPLFCAVIVGVLATGCAARRFTPPSDPGSPFPQFSETYVAVTQACSGVRTFTAELGLSGRAGDQRLRGRVVAGFAAPESMRLEGVAPLGPPAFVLAARDGMATLVLPRENAVLRNAAPADVLEALTGVALQPSALQAILTGCVTPADRAASGRLHRDGGASVTTEGGATLYLQRRNDRWQPRAARYQQWLIEYPEWGGRFPAVVRLRSEGGRVSVDLTAAISQLEANVDLDATAFEVMVPVSARPVTLDDLRESGPLRGQP
jgi:outer membrane biogenesis lipoprotein LolB